MRGDLSDQGGLFSYVSAEERIPADHPLRRIRELVRDVFRELSRSFDGLYSREGRPSIPPEQLLSALLLQALYGVRSERLLLEQLDYNLLFRWFVGLSPDDSVWHPTVFSKNRYRLLQGDIFQKFMSRLLGHEKIKPLLSDEHFSVDGTLIEAWASHKSFKPKDGSDHGDGSNFHGQRRKNDTHASTTDPEAGLYRKAAGREARLSYMGHALMENRHGLAVAALGNHTNLRTKIGALGLTYAAGILSSTSMWAPGTAPLPPQRWSGRGRPPTRGRRDAKHRPVSAKALALGLPKRAWRTIAWRDGSAALLSSRFARVRVRAACRDQPHGEEWLLIEWPKGEKEPTKYWLSTLPHDIAFARLVELAKLRWRIERDYQELKQEFGLGHYEGHGWRGFHHHATLCIAAYGFLISKRGTIPPSGPRAAARFATLELPAGYRPRGAAAPARTAHPGLDRNFAPANDRRSRQASVEMPVLRAKNRSRQAAHLMT